MHVRSVLPDDQAEWIRLLLGLYPEVSEADHAAYVHAFLHGAPHPDLLPRAVFVCERPEGGLAGLIELSVRNYAEGCSGWTPYVESWYVDEGERGRGTGRALMEAVERWARERGFTELASDATADNAASHQAHRAVGFREVERVVVFCKAL